MKPLLSSSALYRRITEAVEQVMNNRGSAGWRKAQIPASYSSGNPTVQLAVETASTAGSKTHRVQQPFSNRTAAPTASQSVSVHFDTDGNRIISGPIVDLSSYVIDSDYLMGLRPVTPGNTSLLTANVEENTTSSSYVKVKEFFVTRPGRYRVAFNLSRTGGTTKAIIKLLRPDGTFISASAEASYISTVYPTFGSFSLDMTTTAWWGAQIGVFLLNDSGPGQTGYISNAVLKYSDASASLSPYDAVLVD